jgi:hypothetical protein
MIAKSSTLPAIVPALVQVLSLVGLLIKSGASGLKEVVCLITWATPASGCSTAE